MTILNTRKKMFLRFLKENNCFHQYVKYNNRYGNITNLVTIASDLGSNEISMPFDWNNTVEGYDYWYNLYKKWKNITFTYALYYM